MTVKQVSALTGVSVRTLQYYDDIGLLCPARAGEGGYRLYDEAALETLQQILFFRELGFKLKEIQAILKDPHFDRSAALRAQRELLTLKRERLSGLLHLIDRLLKGEPCMSFAEFDMSAYFRMLESFKKTHADEIVRRFGSMEQFDEMASDLRQRQAEMADGALAQYGDAGRYAQAMEKSLKTFLEDGPAVTKERAQELIEETDARTRKLTADLTRDPADEAVQAALRELLALNEEGSRGLDMGEYAQTMAEAYASNPLYIEVTDRKYGEGAARFLSRALRAYLAGGVRPPDGVRPTDAARPTDK